MDAKRLWLHRVFCSFATECAAAFRFVHGCFLEARSVTPQGRAFLFLLSSPRWRVVSDFFFR